MPSRPYIIHSDSLSTDSITIEPAYDSVFPGKDDSLANRVTGIRNNFKRINSIKQWTSISQEDLWESTEGGVAKYYYQQKQLEKIVARFYGETYQQLIEYYLLNKQLSFVLERTYRYNRPMYYDSAAMTENDDTEYFNFEKSTIVENRFYFEKGNLLLMIPGKRDVVKNKDEEAKRIKMGFDKLIGLQ